MNAKRRFVCIHCIYMCIYTHITLNTSRTVHCMCVLYVFWTEIFCSNLSANEQCQKICFSFLNLSERFKQLFCAQKILVSGNGGSPNPILFYGDFDPAVFSFQRFLKI